MIEKKFITAALVAVLAAVGFGGLARGQEDRPKIVFAIGDVIDLDGTQATIIGMQEGFSSYPLDYRAEIRNSDGSALAELLLVPHNNRWVVAWKTRNPGNTSCAIEERWIRAFARQAGFSPQGFKVSGCKNGNLHDGYTAVGVYFETNGDIPLKWVGVKPKSAQCTPDAYLGTWQRPGSGKQKPQVQLTFSKDGNEGLAQAKGFARAPYSENEHVLSRIYATDDTCRYKAKCGTVLSASPSCTVVVDPARVTLTIEGGAKIFISDVPWTRASAAPKTATCSARDIDGNWHRSDGALVPIVGIDAGFRDGGNALMFNHPDSWPKGSHKFLRVFREGGQESCKMSAVCINYDINRSTGQTFKRERNCTLTVDPQRQTLRESGSTLSYSRTPRGGQQAPRSITTAPPAPPASLPVTSAQELAEIATRERLNREQAAFAERQLAENAAAKAAFDKATAEREATIARQQAETQRKAAEYAAAMAKWRADVEACQQGDFSRCAPQ